MADREKVIKALEAHGCGKSMWRVCSICEYDKDECIKDRCRDNLLTDAYALLKEQEAVEPETENAVYDIGTWWYICGACKQPIDKTDVFCRHCGRPVKWE